MDTVRSATCVTNSHTKKYSEQQLTLNYMADNGDSLESQVVFIGCCGAYCSTCPPLHDSLCKGCKLGYDNGERDIGAARCAIKRCCLSKRNLNTCADCPDYEGCETIQGFFSKNGYKYRKYHESSEFIRQHGYPAFIDAARSWKRAYGSLKPPEE